MHTYQHACTNTFTQNAKLCHFKANESDPQLHSWRAEVTLKPNFVNLHSQVLNGIKSEGKTRKETMQQQNRKAVSR